MTLSSRISGFLVVLFSLGAATIAFGAQTKPTSDVTKHTIAKLSIPWVPNAGQWDERATFRAQSFAGGVWLTKSGQIVHQFNGASNDSNALQNSMRKKANERARAAGWVLAESFVGGKVVTARGQEEQLGKVTYASGNASTQVSSVTSYGRVDLGEVFPGVNVSVKATNANVEKLFTVAPARDPNVIRVKLDGANALSVAADGALQADTDNGPIRFTAPIAFQETHNGSKKFVSVAYALDAVKQQYGFALGEYDSELPLVIDPLLQSTYHGGSGVDGGYAIAVHPVNGDVYVAGDTASTNFPVLLGAQPSYGGGDSDVFVTRFNAALTARIASSYFGGSGNDYTYTMAIHPANGDIYVVGSTTSSLQGNTNAGGEDGFVVRFAASLASVLSARHIGGTGDETAWGIAIHPLTGDVYVAGETNSSDLPGRLGGAQASNAGGFDAFIARFSSGLDTLSQSTYLGGTQNDRGYAVVVHPSTGEIVIAGETSSSDLPGTAGGAQTVNAGEGDVFVARFALTLQERYQTTYLGGTATERAYAVGVHPSSSEILVAGETTSTDLPGTAGSAQATKGAGTTFDVMIARLDSTLTRLIRATYFGGADAESTQSITVHPISGDIYVAGYTGSTNLPGTNNGIQPTTGGGTDGYIARFDANLSTVRQATYFGGVASDQLWAIGAHPSNGEIYVTGETAGTDLGGVNGGAQTSSGGGDDTSIARLSLDLRAVDVVPDAFTFPARQGVTVSTRILAGPVMITGLAASATVTASGALGSGICISATADCTCGSGYASSATIANDQYLCVRQVSAPTQNSAAETSVIVGGYATKFVSYTGSFGACNLDLDGNGGKPDATTDGLMLVRAMLGFTSAAVTNGAIIGTPPRSTWEQIRVYLNSNCGTNFAP